MPEPRLSAPGADLLTDLPRYAIFPIGVRDEDVSDIWAVWREDSVEVF